MEIEMFGELGRYERSDYEILEQGIELGVRLWKVAHQRCGTRGYLPKYYGRIQSYIAVEGQPFAASSTTFC